MSVSSSTSTGPIVTNPEGIASSMEWEQEEEKAGGTQNDYQLSAQIKGHDYAVRDIACCGADLIASIEEKGRACVWNRVSPTQWDLRPGLEERMHQGLAFVIANVEGAQKKADGRSTGQTGIYPPGTFMSGGADKAARPFTANGSTFPPLLSHNGPVNSISVTSPDHFVVTGSWDGVVRIWHGEECIRTFDKLGHEHGTEVLGLENGSIVTASTNKAILIIDAAGKVLHRIDKAHDAPIRKLITHPLGFASAANDGYVKIWSSSGELLQKIEAHVSSEVKFVYGLAYIPGVHGNMDMARLITCGEDSMVKIFDTQGDCIQTIPHPGPVRAVLRLGSGSGETDTEVADFATACADRTVRIFTRHIGRYASVKDRKDFREIGDLIKAAGGMKQIDTSTLETEEALKNPGTKNGQVKVLKITGRNVPIAYQWSDDLQEWLEIGEAMGAGGSSGGSASKKTLDGQTYDFVSDVYLTDTHKVQLGFNAEDDPNEVTDRFCALYQVPADMRQQIYEFVTPKCDSVAGAARKERLQMEKAAANSVQLQQVPSWVSGGVETYSQANLPAMEKKLRETNDLLLSQSHPHALNIEAMKHFNALFLNLKDATQYHVASLSSVEYGIVKQLIQWPNEHILPVLDMLRILMVHAGGNEKLGADEATQNFMFQQVADGNKPGKDTHKILLLKTISNWLCKRQKTPGERASPPAIPQPVLNLVTRTLQETCDAAKSDNENLALAYVMFMHNLICWFGRLKVPQSDLYSAILSGLLEAFASPSACDIIRSNYAQQLTPYVQPALQSNNEALRQVAQDCKQLFSL